MKKRNLLLVILAILLVFGMVVSCGDPEDGTGGNTGGNTGGSTEGVLSTVTANGSATATTTQLTLNFTKAVTISAGDIELGGAAAASVDKGTLTFNAAKTSYYLAVTVTGGGALTVKVGSVTKPLTVYWLDPYKDYYQDYYINYGKKADNSPITEFLTIAKDKIKFVDNENGTGDAADFLEFTVEKWEDGGTVPTSITSETSAFTGSNYKKAVKLTGKITGAKPPAVGAADTAQVYGSVTCPGITKADISKTTVYIYLYFAPGADDPEDTTLLRSAFSKTAPTTPPARVSNRGEYKVQ
jgi:hypothetical protein